MEVERFRGLMASIVAALAVVGGAVGAVYVWQVSNTINPPPETTLIFGIFTGLIGTGSTYLFITDSASRASHAAERSFSTGSASGSTLPEQVTGAVASGTITTTATTTANPEPVAPVDVDEFTAGTPEPDPEPDAV